MNVPPDAISIPKDKKKLHTEKRLSSCDFGCDDTAEDVESKIRKSWGVPSQENNGDLLKAKQPIQVIVKPSQLKNDPPRLVVVQPIGS